MLLRAVKIIPLMLLLTACVTINIYFPAAQAEQAAEKIIDNILDAAPAKKPAQQPTADDKQSMLPMEPSVSMQVLNFFFPAAHAAGAPNFSVNTPAIRKLEAQMKSRHVKLAPFYRSGAIGYTNNGLVAVHNSKSVGLRDKKKLSSLLKSENADRNALYRAIAAANGHPEWESQVRGVFTRKWIQKASKGWWYQAANKQWKQR